MIVNPTSANCPDITALRPVQPQRQACLRDQDLRDPEVIATQGANFCVTNFREIGQMQMDLMILALQCDLTRVASLQWSTAESTVIHEWLPLEYQGTREHHMMTHNESVDVSTMAAMVDQETAKTIRSDLTKVHTLVRGAVRVHAGPAQGDRRGRTASRCSTTCCFFWTNELGEGGKHTYVNVPMVLAGSCGGQLPTGRYLDYLAGRGAGLRQRHAAQQAVRHVHEAVRHGRQHLRPARLRGNRSGPGARAGLRRMRPARARIALLVAAAVAALAGCTASPTVRGYVGARAAASGPPMPDRWRRSCVGAGAAAVGNPGPSAGCGKPAAQAAGSIQGVRADGRVRGGQRARSALLRAPAAELRSRQALPHRLPGPRVWPAAGPRRARVKAYPMETRPIPTRSWSRWSRASTTRPNTTAPTAADDRGRGAATTCATTASTTARPRPAPESFEYGYFDRLHKQVENDFCVDTSKQFFAGYSSGGWMAHQLGCQFPDVLRAQASVTGGLPRGHPRRRQDLRRSPDRRVPDSRRPGPVERLRGLGRGAGAPAAAQQLRRARCASAPTAPYTIAGVPNNADFNCLRYTGCPAEYPIVFCTSRGKAHGAQTTAAVPGFWQFFESL